MGGQKRQRNLPAHVFINCPFDADYEPIFRAIVFGVLDCGFVPRCAKERFDSAEIRISKIQSLIEDCRLGIHDISRVEVSGSGLPRFNMPYEMGLFIGCKQYGGPIHKSKSALVLDSESYRYQGSVSDIAGQDIRSHGNVPNDALRCVRNWLVGYTEAAMPSASFMIERYLDFTVQIPHMCLANQWSASELEYKEYLSLATVWLNINSQI